MQQLLRVIPFIERGGGVETFVALETNQPRLQCVCQRFGDLRFADASWSFDQQWLTKDHREIQSGGNSRVRNVDLLFQHLLDLFDFFSQFSFPLLAVVASRSKSLGVLISSGKEISNRTSWTSDSFASTNFQAALSPWRSMSCVNIERAKIIG